MSLIHLAWSYIKDFPEYIPAALAGATMVALGLPLYFGMGYFLHRRHLPFPWRLRFASLASYVLFAGLAFIFYSPLANRIPSLALNAYLFATCGMLAYTAVPLFDVFFIEYYFMGVRKLYVSPPLRKVINFGVFCLSFLPIMHYLLRFNPFARVAIPTIATAGIALAFQDTLKAFVAGVGLGRLVRVGDWIVFQDKEGCVTDINWGRTVLRTMQGDLLYIPNTLLLAQPFYNFSMHHAHRLTLKIGVSYTAPPDKVKEAMERCAQNVPEVLTAPKPTAQVLGFEDASVHYGLFYWIEDYEKRYTVQDILATRVWEAFRHEGFELPFPFPTRPIESNPEQTTLSVRHAGGEPS